MIEQILVTHLERRPKRRYMALGTLAAQGYPLDKIEFFRAHDSSKYPNDGDEYAVLQAMRADGFQFDDDFVDVRTVLPNKRSACIWQWTWCSLLRRIADSGKLSVHLCDDILPLIRWERMELLTMEASDNASNFKGIQLSNDVLSNVTKRHSNIDYFNSMLGKGILAANDFGEILSPAGANALLQQSLSRPFKQPHEILGEFASNKTDYTNWFHVLQRTVAHNYAWPRDWIGHPYNPETPGAPPREQIPQNWLDHNEN